MITLLIKCNFIIFILLQLLQNFIKFFNPGVQNFGLGGPKIGPKISIILSIFVNFIKIYENLWNFINFYQFSSISSKSTPKWSKIPPIYGGFYRPRNLPPKSTPWGGIIVHPVSWEKLSKTAFFLPLFWPLFEHALSLWA